LGSALAWLSELVNWFGRWVPRIFQVRVSERAIKYVRGRAVVCEPGLHVYWPMTSETDQIFVTRQVIKLRSQALVTKDGITVEVGAFLVYAVADIYKFLVENYDAKDSASVIALGAVRRAVAMRTFEQLREGRADIDNTLAAQARTLAELEAALAGFDGCSLKVTAKNLCFYRGAPQARLMLIGEAPGRDEDLQGKPFVGRAGQLLDRMLAAIGLSEESVHITNIVYWRPPGNRTPTPQEAQVCRPFLERQVELVAPDIVVLLGGAAAKHIFDVPEGIMRVRGKFRDVVIGSLRVRALATLHPAYLLRTPAAKRLAWRDLLTLKAALRA